MSSELATAQRLSAVPYRRAVGALLALVAPPAAAYLARGLGRGFVVNAALAALAVTVFFALFALPGLVLYALAIVHAAALALWPRSWS